MIILYQQEEQVPTPYHEEFQKVDFLVSNQILRDAETYIYSVYSLYQQLGMPHSNFNPKDNFVMWNLGKYLN